MPHHYAANWIYCLFLCFILYLPLPWDKIHIAHVTPTQIILGWDSFAYYIKVYNDYSLSKNSVLIEFYS